MTPLKTRQSMRTGCSVKKTYPHEHVPDRLWRKTVEWWVKSTIQAWLGGFRKHGLHTQLNISLSREGAFDKHKDMNNTEE